MSVYVIPYKAYLNKIVFAVRECMVYLLIQILRPKALPLPQIPLEFSFKVTSPNKI